MNNHSGINERLRARIEAECSAAQSLSEMEQKLRRWLHWLGNLLLWGWLLWLSQEEPKREKQCPHCDETAKYQRRREGTLHTLFGSLRYRRRYYVCPSCRQGHYPLDDKLGLRPNAMSAESERVAALVGVQMSFAQASDLLAELILLELSDQSIAKATQVYGKIVDETETRRFEELSAPDNSSEGPVPHPVRLYGSLDGGRVQTRAAKGEPQPWRELKIGAWFQARGEPPKRADADWTIQAYDMTYFADVCAADDFGDVFWSTGVDRGAEQTTELIILGDGARWIWDLVDLHFPDAVQIVDWFHASEYLAPVAKQAFANKSERQQWLKRVRDDLWHGRLDAVIHACETHIQPHIAASDDPAQCAVTYYRNNRQRMDYPAYRANGYQIGSGTIESAVKQIAAQRMKVSGARWNLSSARQVAKARAAFLSDQWDELATQREHLAKCA